MANILIVDDNAGDRDFLVSLLGRHGHRLREASSAADALAIARTTPPDLIIADVLMPEMDGYQFARRLRADARTGSTRVIFHTAGYHRASARSLAEACGVSRVLPKPSKPEAVLEAVDSVLSESITPAGDTPTKFEEQHTRVLTQRIFDELAELEKTKQRQRADYRLLFDMNPLPMWIVDPQSLAFLAVNEAAIREYGYSRAEFGRISLRDILCADGDTAPQCDTGAESRELPSEPAMRKQRTKTGRMIEATVFGNPTSFEGKHARLELIQDVTERNRAERSVRESGKQLRRLSMRLRSAQEEERTRVSRYLHDELGQMLTALRMTCGSMKSRLPADRADLSEKLESCLKLADTMVIAVQRVCADLRPGVLDLGIGAAIEWSVRDFQTRSEIACSVDAPADEEALDPACATEMYRMFQEALTNVARHSGATRVEVTLRREGTALVLEVHDNGRGITAAEAGSRGSIGLLGMRERAALIGGTVSIEGSPASGTTVRIAAPVGAGS